MMTDRRGVAQAVRYSLGPARALLLGTLLWAVAAVGVVVKPDAALVFVLALSALALVAVAVPAAVNRSITRTRNADGRWPAKITLLGVALVIGGLVTFMVLTVSFLLGRELEALEVLPSLMVGAGLLTLGLPGRGRGLPGILRSMFATLGVTGLVFSLVPAMSTMLTYWWWYGLLLAWVVLARAGTASSTGSV
jgi:hypothetical protein